MPVTGQMESGFFFSIPQNENSFICSLPHQAHLTICLNVWLKIKLF